MNWQLDDTHTAGISGTSGDDALAVAQALRWTTGPLPIAQITGSPQPDDNTRLAGTLDGLAWTADVDPGPLRTIKVAIGANGGGSMYNDRDSQPDDTPQVSLAFSTAAVPGRGVVTSGFAPPDVVAVRIKNGAATIATVPAYQRSAESFFAVPVPAGLTVTRLEFINATGDVIATVPDATTTPSTATTTTVTA